MLCNFCLHYSKTVNKISRIVLKFYIVVPDCEEAGNTSCSLKTGNKISRIAVESHVVIYCDKASGSGFSDLTTIEPLI